MDSGNLFDTNETPQIYCFDPCFPVKIAINSNREDLYFRLQKGEITTETYRTYHYNFAYTAWQDTDQKLELLRGMTQMARFFRSFIKLPIRLYCYL